MARNRFVTGETVRLDLSDGDWIEVKRELSFGEQQELMAVGVRVAGGFDNPTMDMNIAEAHIFSLLQWLVDWSFTNDKGIKVPLSPASIRNLDLETAAEVEAALMAHKLELEKNSAATTGPTAPAGK